MYQVSFEAATLTLTAYMLCAAAGMFLGGFVASRFPLHSDRVVATCMTVAALLMALCGSGWFNGSSAMVILASTGLAIGVGGPSRDMMIKKLHLRVPLGASMAWSIPALTWVLLLHHWFSVCSWIAVGMGSLLWEVLA